LFRFSWKGISLSVFSHSNKNVSINFSNLLKQKQMLLK
jgi:hypothetical protein